MKSLAMASLLFSSTAAPGWAAPADPPPPLAPSSKWTVDYENASCTLARDFGTGAALTTVGFQPSPLGNTIAIIMRTVGGNAPTTGARQR